MKVLQKEVNGTDFIITARSANEVRQFVAERIQAVSETPLYKLIETTEFGRKVLYRAITIEKCKKVAAFLTK